MALPEHGANPHTVYEKLNMKQPIEVMDFSENVNPAGPPKEVAKQWMQLMEKLSVYPDPEGEPFLSAVGKFHSIETDCLFAGNGAAELLTFIAERYRGKRAIVVHPTFSEYEATLLAKNVEVIRVLSEEKIGFQLPIKQIMEKMRTSDVLYLCTPNNPTGMMPDEEDLLKIIQYGVEVNCEIVLDEAFIDFVDETLSFIPKLMEYPHVIVVRSMTKMYSVPGIRLGYVAANKAVISEMKTLAPHWNVNGIAAHIGAICLQEEEFRRQAIEHSNREREKLNSFLLENGCRVTPSVANFLSFTVGAHRDSKKLYVDLLRKGIVLRHSENFRGMDGRWFRIGMKSETEMTVLKEVLTEWFKEN
ncbi:pyridoxal phosphate-dependent aminotransferase [Sporosarcina sp. FA9]|uniref:pyridoxal phosphate-dependent aminotransferase n=1 Tax=Sporosarcina sp. FA9 TaxID=3413030 RepID=UPI003F65DC3A